MIEVAFPVLYRCLFTNRQRFDQSFGPYQDVDKFPNISSSYQTYLKAVDTVFFVYTIIFLNNITCQERFYSQYGILKNLKKKKIIGKCYPTRHTYLTSRHPTIICFG